MKSLYSAVALAAVAVVALAGGAGCGQAIDINRVAPNAVDKSIFVGEWHYRSLVVDKQYENDMVFLGLEGGLERVRWEITENQLIAFRSYERHPGSDPSNPGDQNVLAIFPISKHFDIRRQYNSVNGVENNVIEENTSDRVWWERDFMRVDWSKNLAVSYDLAGYFGPGVNHNANNDPAYPWKTRISSDYIETTIDTAMDADPYLCYYLDGLFYSRCNPAMVKVKLSFKKVDPANDYVELNYPDFTTPAIGELERVDTGEPIFASVLTSNNEFVSRTCTTDETGPDNIGTFLVIEEDGVTRMCNTDPFRGDDVTDCFETQGRCANAETLRFAGGPEDIGLECNLSVHDPDDCFEFTIPVFERFGFFRTDRFVQDRENGFTLTGRERLINRWNIWQNSRDAEGKPLPYSARTPKPIVYHLNVGFPPDMMSTVRALEADWDVAFRAAVAAAQNKPLAEVTTQMVEFRDNSCNIAAVQAFAAEHGFEDDLKQNRIDEVSYGNLENACAVLEHVSIAANRADPEVPVFHWEQLGDLRYSFLNWAAKPDLAGPLGYGPSAADPITGEIISANANVYGASVDTYANWAADIVQLINDELTTNDIINGTHIREHVEATRNRWRERMPKDQVVGFERLFDERTRHMDDEHYFVQKPLTAVNEGLDRLTQSGIEEDLVTSEMAALFGNDLVAQSEGRITERMIDQARPSQLLRTALPDEARAFMLGKPVDDQLPIGGDELAARAAEGFGGSRTAELADYLGRKNFCFLAQQVEPAVADLATELSERGLNREQVTQLVREQIFIGVMAHELGHTFGLRHNFEGSADAINFFPDFWDVGEEALDDEHKHFVAKNRADLNGDGVSDADERTRRKSEVGYSSIMDYHQRFNSDWAGIGLYDKAAVKMGYGEMVEIFDESEVNGNFVARSWLDSIFILDPYSIPWLVGGTTDAVTGGSTADERIDQAYSEVYAAYEAGDEYALLDIQNNSGLLPQAANLYKRRDIPMRDYLRNETLRRAFVGSYDNIEGLQNAGLLDDDGRAPKFAVPYTFCSDAYAWGGNLTCNRYDLGITSQEIVTNAGQMYEFYYPFDAFRRERVLNPLYPWSWSYMNRLRSRTYQPMLNAFRYFYYYRRGSVRLFPAIRDWSEASLLGMNFFARVLQQPDTGSYCLNNPVADGGAYVPVDSLGSPADCASEPLELTLAQGRKYLSTWDSEYEYRPNSIGNFYDKYAAIHALTDSNAFFFRDFSSYTNRGAFSIGYYRVFQPEMLKLFGSIMEGDVSRALSPHVVADADGELTVTYKPFITTDIYGQPVEPDPSLEAGDPIAPSQSFYLRRWAAVVGMINLSSTLDQTADFAQRARVVIAGSASDPVRDPDVIDPSQIADFTDPLSGVVYRSVEVDGADASIGARLVRNAQDFADGEWTDAQNALAAAQAGGTPEELAAARTRALVADAKLSEKVVVLDYMVLLGNIFEFPGG